MSLLWLMEYWHGLVKMRLHVESSVILADQTLSTLGTQLRHFEQVLCPRYPTRETQREHAARLRAKQGPRTQSGIQVPMAKLLHSLPSHLAASLGLSTCALSSSISSGIQPTT